MSVYHCLDQANLASDTFSNQERDCCYDLRAGEQQSERAELQRIPLVEIVREYAYADETSTERIQREQCRQPPYYWLRTLRQDTDTRGSGLFLLDPNRDIRVDIFSAHSQCEKFHTQ